MYKNKAKVENHKPKKINANINKKKNQNPSTLKKSNKKKKGTQPKPKDYLLMVMDMDKKAKKNHISYKKEKAVEKPFIKIQEKQSGFRRSEQQYFCPLFEYSKSKRHNIHHIDNRISLNQNSLIKDEIENCEEDLIFMSEASQLSRENQIFHFQSYTHEFELDEDDDHLNSFETSTDEMNNIYLGEEDIELMNEESDSYFESSQSSDTSIMGNIERIRVSNFSYSADQVIQDELSYEMTIYDSSESSSQISLQSQELDENFPISETKPHHFDKQCSICLEYYKQEQIIRELPCSHIFHKECIDHWIKKHVACPFCRHIL